jgi:hypothetical protein
MSEVLVRSEGGVVTFWWTQFVQFLDASFLAQATNIGTRAVEEHSAVMIASGHSYLH